MVFYLIGLGLNKESISIEAKKELEKCEKVYLEKYTVDFPYSLDELEKALNKKMIFLKREDVESEIFILEAKEKNIALLVYGDPFTATTHSQLIIFCKSKKIPFKIFHNSSIMNSVGETGLSLYKFGKSCSIPKWSENYKPTSFINYLKENKKIKAHSLIIVDIDITFKEAIFELEEASKKEKFSLPKKILVVSKIGTEKQKIIYKKISEIKNEEIEKPFSLIIPSKMHYLERKLLNQ